MSWHSGKVNQLNSSLILIFWFFSIGPMAPTMICGAVIFMFHNFFGSLARLRYLFSFSNSFIFTRIFWNSEVYELFSFLLNKTRCPSDFDLIIHFYNKIPYCFCLSAVLCIYQYLILVSAYIYIYIYMGGYAPSRYIRSSVRALSPWLVNSASLICDMNRRPSGRVLASAYCRCGSITVCTADETQLGRNSCLVFRMSHVGVCWIF